MRIGERTIGEGHPCFIIAEMSANHRGDYAVAEKLVHAAKEAGADAVKLQTYTADTITIKSDKPPFQIGGGTLWDGKTLHALYQEAYTPWDWQPKLKALSESLGMECFSSPFDDTAVDFLEAGVEGCPYHCPQGRVHTRCIAAAGQYAELASRSRRVHLRSPPHRPRGLIVAESTRRTWVPREVQTWS